MDGCEAGFVFEGSFVLAEPAVVDIPSRIVGGPGEGFAIGEGVWVPTVLMADPLAVAMAQKSRRIPFANANNTNTTANP